MIQILLSHSPRDFFKVLLKFKMAATDKLFWRVQKQKIIWSFFFEILTSHS